LKVSANVDAPVSSKRGLKCTSATDDLRDDDEMEEDQASALKERPQPYTSAFTRKRAKLSSDKAQKEAGVDRRHAECMQRQDRFLDIFSELVTKK
jgi:hypothetical protein